MVAQITPLPDPPSTNDPANFNTRADAFLGQMPTFVTEANALSTEVNGLAVQVTADKATTTAAASAAAISAASALNAPGTLATSSTSLTIGAGSKSFTLDQTGKNFAVGQRVTIAQTSSPTNLMGGIITAFTSGTGAITVSADYVPSGASGTASGWTISLAGQPVQTPSPTGYAAKTGAYTVTAADWGKIIDCTSGTFTLTFSSAATLGSGFYCYLKNTGTGVITGPTVDGATLSLGPGDEVMVECDGSALHGMKLKKAGWTLILSQTVSTPVATVDFTNIPQTYASLKVEAIGARQSSGGNRAPTIGISTNNGSSYSSYSLGSSAFPTATTGSIDVILPSYRQDVEAMVSAGRSAGDVGAVTLIAHTGGVNALQMAFSSAANWDAGTFKLWAR